MIINMRTTLTIDDVLVREAKQRAISLNLSLSEFVNQALREVLRISEHTDDPPFTMITFGPADSPSHHEPADFKAVLDEDDVGSRQGG